MSPNVPEARVIAPGADVINTFANPAFLADAKKRNIVVAPLQGEELAVIVGNTMKIWPVMFNKFEKMVKIEILKPSKRKKK